MEEVHRACLSEVVCQKQTRIRPRRSVCLGNLENYSGIFTNYSVPMKRNGHDEYCDCNNLIISKFERSWFVVQLNVQLICTLVNFQTNFQSQGYADIYLGEFIEQ